MEKLSIRFHGLCYIRRFRYLRGDANGFLLEFTRRSFGMTPSEKEDQSLIGYLRFHEHVFFWRFIWIRCNCFRTQLRRRYIFRKFIHGRFVSIPSRTKTQAANLPKFNDQCKDKSVCPYQIPKIELSIATTGSCE